MSSENKQYFKTSINEYLESLPESIHLQLYRSPETCLAIFKLLPSLAKFYIMTLIFQDTAVPYSDLNRWIKQSTESGVPHHRNPNKMYQSDCLKRLKALNLLKEMRKQMTHPQTGQTTTLLFIQLNSVFKQSFRIGLTGTGEVEEDLAEEVEVQKNEEATAESKSEDKSSSLRDLFAEDNVITIDFLDKYCLTKWENILHFMVGSEVREFPSIGVLTLLRHSGLMELAFDKKKREQIGLTDVDVAFEEENEGTPSFDTLQKLIITNDGFQFLLQDINPQIWTLLLQYLKLAENLKMNPVDVLNFIFMLGSLELGKGYPVKMLSDTQASMMEDLIDYGLIYYPPVPKLEGDISLMTEDQLKAYEKSKTNRMFYPTRLATTLTSENCNFKTAAAVISQEINNARDSGNNGSLIIETNFKLYCYTSSPLQIAILNLFVHLKTRFTNMVTGAITRESVRSALLNGITSAQIIGYLESHAHPGMVRLAEEKLAKKIEFETSIGGDKAALLETRKLEILPPTVVDQIKLWQLELDRIQSFRGYLYKDFATEMEFEKLCNYGEEIGVVLWKDKLRRKFFVDQDGNAQIIEYANRILRKGNQQRAVPPTSA